MNVIATLLPAGLFGVISYHHEIVVKLSRFAYEIAYMPTMWVAGSFDSADMELPEIY